MSEEQKEQTGKPATPKTAFRRLNQGSLDVGKLGVAKKSGRQTKPWSVHTQAETATKLIRLFDEWAGINAADHDVDALPNARNRKDLAAGEPATVIGVAVPLKTYEMVEGLGKTTGKKTNFVGAWCIADGIKTLNLDVIARLLPGKEASLSLVCVLALQIGLTSYPKEFKPVDPDAAPVAVGRRRKPKVVS